MSELKIIIEWEDPAGARGPELRATWARLQILIGSEVITRVEDRTVKSVRDGVYGPLYPLAEWIVMNWWPLFYEVPSPVRPDPATYARRHLLAYASEGFALPRLLLQPEGELIRAEWRQTLLPAHRLEFRNQGVAYLDRAQAQDTFRGLVMAVIGRLDEQGISSTSLEEEWRAIETASKDEIEFCHAAGRLGWDPYALTDQQQSALLTLAEQLPIELLDEYLTIAEPSGLEHQAAPLLGFLQRAARLDLELPALQQLRQHHFRVDNKRSPWEQGYLLAREVRPLLVDLGHASSLEQLRERWRIVPATWTAAIQVEQLGSGLLDAVYTTTRNGAPCFALQPRRPASQLFQLVRAIAEYLAVPHERAALITAASSSRQKRNRAFAAEFLAPAEEIRARIKLPAAVSWDEIQDLAQEFGVSDYVIYHQIENHRIGKIVGQMNE